MAGEVICSPHQDCQEVGLGSADCSLCRVPPVHVGRDKLVSHTSLFSRQISVLLVALIIKDFEIYEEVLDLQSFYDDCLGVEAADILLGCYGLD